MNNQRVLRSIYDADPLTDDTVLSLADLRFALAAYSLEVDQRTGEQVGHWIDLWIAKERERVGISDTKP